MHVHTQTYIYVNEKFTSQTTYILYVLCMYICMYIFSFHFASVEISRFFHYRILISQTGSSKVKG